MSVQTPQHDEQTKENFEDLLHQDLISRDNGRPSSKKYSVLEPNGSKSARIGLHYQAWRNSPLTPGDKIEQLYFEELGIVVLDLNPDTQ